MAKRKIILYLTDIALHTNTSRPATTLEKAIKGQLPNGLPYGRIYTNSGPNGELMLKIPQDMEMPLIVVKLKLILQFLNVVYLLLPVRIQKKNLCRSKRRSVSKISTLDALGTLTVRVYN